MAEQMEFLPRSEILSLEELLFLSRAFVARGVTRIRLTGGEPLVRRGAVDLAHEIGGLLGKGLEELTLTTNGARLSQHSDALWDAGIRRINVSLDSRDPKRFSSVTRLGNLADVLEGLAAARARGFLIKINTVALKGVNEDELGDMLAWCCEQGFDLSLIETMPLGDVGDDRTDRFLPLTKARAQLETRFTLSPSPHRTGGPARYWDVAGSRTRLGLISPLTENFCAACNRVRVSASGQLFMCLGHEDHVDLRSALRSMGRKPERHEFDLRRAATRRHMNVTGG